MKGLLVDMARTDGIVLRDTPNATATNLQSNQNGRSGLLVATSVQPTGTNRGPTIRNSAFADNPVIGVDASNANRVTVAGSSVTDTGTLAWSGVTLAGIWVNDGGQVTNDTLSRLAYIGVRFSSLGGTTVSGNSITGECQRLSDCGGIYTQNEAQAVPTTGALVQDNVVGAAVPDVQGAPVSSLTTVAGIYLDDYSQSVQVTGNTVSGTPIGLMVHNSSGNTISGNRLWLNTSSSLFEQMDRIGTDAMTNNVITDNQFAPASTSQGTFPALPTFTPAYAIRFWTTAADASSITSGSNHFAGNQLMALQTGSAPMAEVRTGQADTPMSANGWRTLAPGDVVAAAPVHYALIRTTTGDELQANGGFDAGLAGWATWYAMPGGAAAATTGFGCDGACASFRTTSVNDNLYGQNFGLVAGAMYDVSYTASFTAPAALNATYMTMGVAPFSSVVSSDGMKYANPLNGNAGDVIASETFFHASMTTPARVNLKVATPGVPVLFDSVSVRPVTGYTAGSSSAWAATAIAGPAAALSVDCAALGWDVGCTAVDVNGNAVAWPAAVPAGSAQMFLRTDSAWVR